MWGATPCKRDLFIKLCVFILTCLNFRHLQSTLHLMQYTYRDVFSTAQSSFWTHWFWCLLVLLLFFVSPLPHGKMFPFQDYFYLGKQKMLLGQDWVNREGGAWEPCCFWSKLLNAAMCVSRCACKLPIMKWVPSMKESSKKFTEAKCSCHINISWYIDTDGFLEHSPSQRSLY